MTATSPSTTSLIPGSSGRPSTSSLAGYNSNIPNYSQGIGYSPSTPASPATSSGIPSFRSLRSLLPFGPNKNATPTSHSTSSPNNLSRSPFGAFGSVRRSMTKDRERNASLSNDAMMPPVLAIEKSNGGPSPDDTPAIRRSLSLSTLEKPLPSEPSSSSLLGDKLLPSRFTLRTPSPGPPLSADLSTIIEADSSGVLKQITANSSPTSANLHNTKSAQGHDSVHGNPTHERDVDASAMDLSTTHLADQVRDAIREGDSSNDQWLNPDKTVIIIDGDEHPEMADTAFNMDSVDRDLADLLNPHSATKQVLQTSSTPNQASRNPTTPKVLGSPASRLPRARQASSFLPRVCSPNSSSPSPQFPVHHTPPHATPKPSSSIVVNGNGYNALKSSPSPAIPPTSTPLRDRDVNGRGTPSLRMEDTTVTAVSDRPSPISRIPNTAARMRKRSMSVQERFERSHNEDIVRSGSSLSNYRTKPSRGSGGGVESSSCVSSSSGPKMEWLGPRTAKAFRAAGLLDFDREKERDREEGSESTERLRSTSGVLSPSPLGTGNSASALNRFASLRSVSEYNSVYGRSHSRSTLSEAGSGVPRRGSESFSVYGSASSHGGNGGGGGGGGSLYGYNGLMESPTFTVSSGSRERDTPKSSISSSTAPTSLADSFGYLGRDRSERDLNREREREREEIREMKEKHGTEMGALLGALSDSQRTVRMLREENSDLRDRLERFTVAVQANQELRQMCGDLQNETSILRRENVDLRKELVGLRGLTHSWSVGGGGNSSGSRTSVPKAAISSPLARTSPSLVVHEEYDDTFIDHGSEVENNIFNKDSSTSDILSHSSPVPSKKRRLSNSSSIFPIPPSNMTLLLHEDVTSTLGSIASCSPSTSSQRKTLSQPSPPISYLNFAGNIPPDASVTSVGSISNFSMATGSPGSLFLRPEHEILLGDMESLDLGVRGGDGEVVGEKVDEW